MDFFCDFFVFKKNFMSKILSSIYLQNIEFIKKYEL